MSAAEVAPATSPAACAASVAPTAPISALSPAAPGAAVDQVDTSFLETLMGYNARRASLTIIARFMTNMTVYDLRPVDFSVMSLITHNPGITSRQLCTALGLLPPNLVGMINALERRSLIERRPHPSDGRAMGLHPSEQARHLMQQAERTATQLERQATAQLSPAEHRSLIRLLKKIYLNP